MVAVMVVFVFVVAVVCADVCGFGKRGGARGQGRGVVQLAMENIYLEGVRACDVGTDRREHCAVLI